MSNSKCCFLLGDCFTCVTYLLAPLQPTSLSLPMLSVIDRLNTEGHLKNTNIQKYWMFHYFSLSFSLSCVCVLPAHTAQPMHWIYNPDTLKEVLSDLEPCPEFRPQSANPFYRRTTGEQTCYGDQAYVLLESLSQCGGTETGSTKYPVSACQTHGVSLFSCISNKLMASQRLQRFP